MDSNITNKIACLGNVPLNSVPIITNCLVHLRSSTDYNSNHGVQNILLNFSNGKSTVSGSEGWVPSIVDKNQFVVAGSSDLKEIMAISIQGRGDQQQWVTSFRIRYTMDNMTWVNYNNGQVLSANDDQNSIITYVFPNPIQCRSIAIHPVTWKDNIAMRMELYAKPITKTMVQVGSVSIGNRDLNSGSGLRETIRRVTFDKPFTKIPMVSIGCSLVDATGDGQQMRWNITTKNIQCTGFDMVFSTWCNNQIYDLRAEYTAVGQQ
ncbi:discoidin II [Tieghemostelium lacteum]|uniref:Discoidin II n=1 Tax=Tieghemostelium lacteum TaxID=361077 RepID=A0A152A1R7_TIELA|nr:discoidin II [Tieghemostelium lacteum]|eukprot:KYR00154.1 discoidin II [Tieghemostelium lacteum]